MNISRIQGYLLVKIAHRFLPENSQNLRGSYRDRLDPTPSYICAIPGSVAMAIRLAAILGFSLIAASML